MNILVIDDHPLYRIGVVYQLQATDPAMNIRECASVKAGIDLIESGYDVALMILDLHMPGYTGVGALQEVRDKRPDIPVLVLSGQEDAALVRHCVECGAFGFVPKAAPPDTLHLALKLVLSGGVYLPASSLSIVQKGECQPSANSKWERLGAHLTDRQREVLLKIAQGKPNKVIARELGLSDSTVKTHVNNIFNALDISNRTQAVYALARAGMSIYDAAATTR
jgi:DNA-binding NarL/FixJ family response regulator